MCHQLRLLCHTAIFHFGKIIILAFKFCIQFSPSVANKICLCGTSAKPVNPSSGFVH